MAGQWSVGDYKLKIADDGKFTLGEIDGKYVSGTFTASDSSDYPAKDNWLKAQDPKFKVTAYVRSIDGNLEVRRVCNPGAKACTSASLSGKRVKSGNYKIIYSTDMLGVINVSLHTDLQALYHQF